MTMHLTAEQRAAIRAAGEAAFPHECCGFLMGRHDHGARRVAGVLPVANARPQPERRNRYSISPEDYLRGDRQARGEGLEIIGFYHSHPNAPARPSVYDREQAWPWYSYVIVSVQDGRAGDMTSWVLRDDRSEFDPEPMATL